MLNGKPGRVVIKTVFILSVILGVPTMMAGGTVVDGTFNTERCEIKFTQPYDDPAYTDAKINYDPSEAFMVEAEVTPTEEGADCSGQVVWQCVALGNAECPEREKAFPGGYQSVSGQSIPFAPRAPGKYKVKATFERTKDKKKVESESGEIIAVKLVFLRNTGAPVGDQSKECLNISNEVTTGKMGYNGNLDPDNFKVRIEPPEARAYVYLESYSRNEEDLQGELMPTMDSEMTSEQWLRLVSNQVDNESMPDQTLLADVDGKISLNIITESMDIFNTEMFVCKPKTERVALNIIIFNVNEQYRDKGLDKNDPTNTGAQNGIWDYKDVNNDGQYNHGEPCEDFTDINENQKYDNGKIISEDDFYDKYIHVAQETWAQCCVVLANSNGVDFEINDIVISNTPKGLDLADGLEPFNESTNEYSADEIAILSMKDNYKYTIDIFVVNFIVDEKIDDSDNVIRTYGYAIQVGPVTKAVIINTCQYRPFALPHEMGHVLGLDHDPGTDTTSLMKDMGTSEADSVLATKRISSSQCTTAIKRAHAIR